MDLPNNSIKLRYVKSPTAKDIRLFLAYFPFCKNNEELPIKYIETKNEKSLLVPLQSGELHGQLMKPDDMCFQQKIAILDKENMEAVIYDADFYKMTFQRQNEHLLKMENEGDTNKVTKRSLLKATLSANFGSSMSKKLVRNKNKNNDNRAGIDATIEFLESDVVMNDVAEQEEVQDEDVAAYFPPHNKEASYVADAFPLDGIITIEELEAMYNVSKEFIDCDYKTIDQWERDKTYGAYVSKELRRLPVDNNRRQHLSCLLMYFHYLVTLYSCKAPELKKRDFLPRTTPPSIKNKLIQTFTLPLVGQRQGRTMPAKMKDILLFHILVLCLHIDDFNVHVSDLNEDLKAKDLIKYFRMIGCKVTKIISDGHIRNNATALLKVPLNFPEFERRGRKRKGAMK